MVLYVNSGIMALAHMVTDVKDGMCVGRALSLGRWASRIRLLPIRAPALIIDKASSVFNISSSGVSSPSSYSGGFGWSIDDFVNAHKEVIKSGKFNFEGCRIPIPTAIRYDRIKEALGVSISPREERVLSLLEFGMPIDCNPRYGVRKPQKKSLFSSCL